MLNSCAVDQGYVRDLALSCGISDETRESLVFLVASAGHMPITPRTQIDALWSTHKICTVRLVVVCMVSMHGAVCAGFGRQALR